MNRLYDEDSIRALLPVVFMLRLYAERTRGRPEETIKAEVQMHLLTVAKLQAAVDEQ